MYHSKCSQLHCKIVFKYRETIFNNIPICHYQERLIRHTVDTPVNLAVVIAHAYTKASIIGSD